MTFHAKLDIALEKLAATGMWRSNYAPPLYRLLWTLGVPLPPPPFAGFVVNLLYSALWFGGLYGVAMWLVWWRHIGVSTSVAIMTAISAGILFGLCMAAYWWYKARRHKLPSWSDLNANS